MDLRAHESISLMLNNGYKVATANYREIYERLIAQTKRAPAKDEEIARLAVSVDIAFQLEAFNNENNCRGEELERNLTNIFKTQMRSLETQVQSLETQMQSFKALLERSISNARINSNE